MAVEENKFAVRRFIEALDTDDLSVLGEVCTPEVAEDWREGINTGRPFGEHHIAITDIVAEDNKVVAFLATRGVQSGEWEGVPPTGKRFTNKGTALFRLEDGRIVDLSMLFDELNVLKQLGATVTPPASV